jgi:glycine/serine hydroxymethyltransferase
MKEPEMDVIADLLIKVLNDPKNSENIKHVRDRVKSFCRKFPVYEDKEI